MSDQRPPEPKPLPIDDYVPRERRRGPKWWVLPSVIATVCALVVSLGALVVLQRDNDRTVRDSAQSAAISATAAIETSQVVACNRAQVQRAVERIVAAQGAEQLTRLFEAYLPILDCAATYNGAGGRGVPLDPQLERCFIGLVRGGYFLDAPFTTSPARLRRVCS